MITAKKLIRMARKWQRIAASGRRRITCSASQCSRSSAVDRGSFVIYTMDERRFVIPLAFLSNTIFHELLKMSEEEFGLPSDGPITLPCDSLVMNYIVSLLKRGGIGKDLERALLTSITTYRCSRSSSTYFHQGFADRKSIVCGV